MTSMHKEKSEQTAIAPLRVALLAMGGSRWIAGVNYLHSLLYGNSLLPAEEQGSLHLYLDFVRHHVPDFEPMRTYSAGFQVTDFFPAPSNRHYLTMRRLARVVIRHRRWPRLPKQDLSRLLRKHRADVIFAGNNIGPRVGIPRICWIPDFQHFHLPEFFSAQERQNRDRHFARTMAEADCVIVSNQCTYADAVRLFPEYRHKLAVLPFTMYLGADWQKIDTGPVLQKYELPKKFLLFPSQFWKHKNHITLFRAIERVRERGMNDVVLVCTGYKHDSRFPDHDVRLKEFLDRHELAGTIRVLGFLPRKDQVQLMRAAAAIVQPSLFEGWSALLEEARSLGKTVFASAIPMHQEQFAEGVHLFSPTSADELSNLLIQHWPLLKPGPESAREAAAKSGYCERIREFGRQFNNICRNVTELTRRE